MRSSCASMYARTTDALKPHGLGIDELGIEA
jgi:hypothetical protein